MTHQCFNNLKSKNPDFKVFLVTIYDALKEGLVTQEFINKARIELGALYPQTYEGSFIAGIGNVFTPEMIDKAIELGERLKDIAISQYTLKCCAIDPGFGSSATGVLLAEHLKEEGKILIRYSKEFTRPDPQYIANLCFEFHRKYMNTWFVVDGANRGFVTELKIMFGKDPDFEYKDINPETMRVIPVNFAKDHRDMLSKLYLMMHKQYIGIPKEHELLVTSLRTAQASEYSLDKTQTSHSDILDALRLSLKGYNLY
jgi:hypothetical protein